MQVRRLLKGKALSVEDAVDVLTLKDNAADTDREDFVIALHLLARAAVSTTHVATSGNPNA